VLLSRSLLLSLYLYIQYPQCTFYPVVVVVRSSVKRAS